MSVMYSVVTRKIILKVKTYKITMIILLTNN